MDDFRDILKSRYGRLLNGLNRELDSKLVNKKRIVKMLEKYEVENQNYVKNLKSERIIDKKRISGALKQTIDAHGPITPLLIGSATKRIVGSLLTLETKKVDYIKHNKMLLFVNLILFILLIFTNIATK